MIKFFFIILSFVFLPIGLQSHPTNNNIKALIFKVKGVTFRMNYIEGGTFVMGASMEQLPYAQQDEYPAHKTTVDCFYLGDTEVTQELWTAVMGKNPSKFKGEQWSVEYVTYNDCIDFIKKLNCLTGKKFRLPTEAEWEYAARGGNKSHNYIYSGGNNATDVAWLWIDGIEDAHNIVKTKKPNELGLYDMSGSVWEWCESPYEEYTDRNHNIITRFARQRFRVIRGGAYNGSPQYSRVSNRNLFVVWRHDDTLGFRLAL